MSYQLIQSISNLFELIKRSRLIDCIIDIRMMRKRINDTLNSFLLDCNKERGPLVSIVIPTQNESKRLPMLLNSLRSSCYQDIEIIVADYRSSDDTPQIAKMYGARIIYLNKPGVGYASYVAVDESRGEIVIRTDADAVFTKDIISRIVKIFSREENKLVAHVGHIYYDGGFIENLMAFYYDKYLRKSWNTTGHFIAFRRDLDERGINFDPRLRYDEDYDFGYRVYQFLGPGVFYYNWYKSVLVSARRIKATGLVKYVLGFRER